LTDFGFVTDDAVLGGCLSVHVRLDIYGLGFEALQVFPEIVGSVVEDPKLDSVFGVAFFQHDGFWKEMLDGTASDSSSEDKVSLSHDGTLPSVV
jgi:hypothetical protein